VLFNRARKSALVIGNGAYGRELTLDNPANDASAISYALSALDFTVTTKIDLNFQEMNNLIADFVGTLRQFPAEVALFYFSGHGLQIDGQNYLVPIDFDQSSRSEIHFIRLQAVIDRISENSDIKIILLDACRNNSPNVANLKNRSLRFDSGVNGPRVDDNTQPAVGLAEIKAESNTFIAFAAAPGGIAYDGEGRLSPFTGAIVKHIDAVDLPLYNLTSRVRQEVLRATDGLQQTWDHSSLVVPFFFNPGSLLLFTGNMMALIGLFISVIPYSLLLTQHDDAHKIMLAALLPITSLVILIWGMQSVYSRMRGRFKNDPQDHTTFSRHLWLSLQKGFLGGYLGSLIAAILITIPYLWLWRVYANLNGTWIVNQNYVGDIIPESLGSVLLDATLSTILGASVLGFFTLYCVGVKIRFFGLRFMPNNTFINVLTRACLGGVLAGSVIGPIMMLHFAGASTPRPELLPPVLLPGAVVGAPIVIFSILSFDLDRLTINRVMTGAGAAVLAVIGGFAVAATIFWPLYNIGAVDMVKSWMENQEASIAAMIVGGMIYGIPVGVVLGIVMGSAIILTKRMSGRPVV
jgi:hypothetical protein